MVDSGRKRAALRIATSVSCALGIVVMSIPALAQEPKLLRTLPAKAEPGCIHCVAISPDSKTIVCGENNDLRIWNVTSGKEIAALNHASEIGFNSLAFSPDGKKVACGLFGNTIKILDMTTRKFTTLHDDEREYSRPQVVFSPDGKTLASGGRCTDKIRLWNLDTGKPTVTIDLHSEYGVSTLAFSIDGKTLNSVALENNSHCSWDMTSGKEMCKRVLPNMDWYALAFSPDAKVLAVEIEDKNIQIREVSALKEIVTLKGHSKDLRQATFSPDGRKLASQSERGEIELWDVKSGKGTSGFQGQASCLTFSADGTMLVVGQKDGSIKIWDLGKN
jgi:WD40 repeat protein